MTPEQYATGVSATTTGIIAGPTVQCDPRGVLQIQWKPQSGSPVGRLYMEFQLGTSALWTVTRLDAAMLQQDATTALASVANNQVAVVVGITGFGLDIVNPMYAQRFRWIDDGGSGTFGIWLLRA